MNAAAFRGATMRIRGMMPRLEMLDKRILPSAAVSSAAPIAEVPRAPPTIVVTGLGDPGVISDLHAPRPHQFYWSAPNLRSALANARQTGSTIDTIVLPAGVLQLRHGVLEVGSGLNLTIATTATIIDAGHRSQILQVDADSTVEVHGVLFLSGQATGGNNGGAIINNGTLTLVRCAVADGVTVGPAGGIGGYGGGGIDNEGTLNLQYSLIAFNRVIGTTKTASLTAANGAYGQEVLGGGIYDNGFLTAVNSIFVGNQALGGAIVGNISSMGAGSAYGGAIAITLYSASITGCTFVSNQAIGGSVISTAGGNDPTGSVAAADARGGALFQQATNAYHLTITNSTFAFNAAVGGNGTMRAGAIELAYRGVGQGGGLYLGIYHNSVELINDTIAYNRAGAGTGAAASEAPDGGGIYADPGVSIWNTLVAANTASSPASGSTPAFARTSDVAGSFVSLGHNLIGSIDAATGFSHALGDMFGGAGAAPLDPGLDGQLRFNGGLTPTLALLPGGPAIDHGDNGVLSTGITADQRGIARPQGSAVDIGAFEITAATTIFWK
jgi:hypothetical protein